MEIKGRSSVDIYSELNSNQRNELAMILAKIKRLKKTLTEQQIKMLRYMLDEATIKG